MPRFHSVVPVLVLLAASLLPTAASRASVDAPVPSPPARGGAAQATEVTLLTGEVVRVSAGADGPAYELDPSATGARPAEVMTSWDDGDLYVIPRDVIGAVGTLLDRELFNVTRLVELGYDDRSADRLPVTLEIAQPGPRDSTAIDVLVTSADGAIASADVIRGAAAALRADLVDGSLAGIERIWLDPAPAAGREPARPPVGAPDVSINGPGSEAYDLTVRVLDSAGNPYAGGLAEIYNKESFTRGFFPGEELDAAGEVTVQVEAGPFSITSLVQSPDGTLAVVAEPEIMVDGDRTIVLDARDAEPVSAEVEGVPTELTQLDLHYVIADEEGRSSGYSAFPDPAAVDAGDVRATPADDGDHGGFFLVTRWRLEADAEGERPSTVYDLLFQDEGVAEPPAYVQDPDDVSTIAEIDSTYQGLGEPLTLRSVRGYIADVLGIALITDHPLAIPQHRLEVVSARADTAWYGCVYPSAEIDSRVCEDEAPARPTAERKARWLDVVHPGPYLLQRWDDATLFTQMGLSDGAHTGVGVFESWERSTLTLYDDAGGVVDQGEGDFAYLTVPPGAGTYTLEQVAELKPDLGPMITTATTRWTFHTDTPPEGLFENTRHLNLGYRPKVDQLGVAAAGEGMRFGLRTVRRGDAGEAAPIAQVELAVSVDGGTTWVDLPLRVPDRSDGDRFVTRVPRRVMDAGTSLAVRATVVDDAGLAVEQTLTDAIPVR